MNTKHKQRTNMKTESITLEERTKGSDRYREDNQSERWWSPGDSEDAQVCVTMVTGERHNKQPGDLEAGEGAHSDSNAL